MAERWQRWLVVSDDPWKPQVSTFDSDLVPTAVRRRHDALDVFVMGNDSRIWWDSADAAAGPGWRGWWVVSDDPVDASVSTFARLQPVALARQGEALDVLAMGNDSRIWWNAWYAGAGWRGWRVVSDNPQDPNVSAFFGGSTPAVASRDPDHMDAFTMGNDSRIWWNAWDSAGGWHGWSALSDDPSNPNSATFWKGSAPVVVAPSAGRLDVFVMGNDSRVWTKTWDAATGWHAWSVLTDDPGDPNNGTFWKGSAPAVAAWAPDRLDVFVMGNDSRIWTKMWDAGTGWQAWSVLSDDLGDPNNGTFWKGPPISAVARGADGLDVFAMGNDARVWTKAWDAANGWQPWSVLSDIPCGADNSAFRTGVSAVGGQGALDVFVAGNDSRVWSRSWGPASDGAWIATDRICQLTGDADPEGLLHVNRTIPWGCEGTDMGVPIDHEGRLYLFLGDVISHGNADPIVFTTAPVPDPNDLGLTPIFAAGSDNFDPYRIDDGAGPRSLGTNETPTGGFSYAGELWVFCVTGNDAPVSHLTRSSDPGEPFSVELTLSSHSGPARFLLPHGLVVRTSDWPELHDALEGADEALVIWGWGIGQDTYGQPFSAPNQVPAGISLAVAPISPGATIGLQDLRYWSPGGWMRAEVDGRPLFPTVAVPHVSVAWLEGPERFVMLMTRAAPDDPTGAIVARVGSSPSVWSEEIVIFDPLRDGAYGRFMHWPGCDDLDVRFACATPRGWAYAPGIIERFTTWDPSSRTATLVYTMSTGAPYEVQLMRSTIRIES